MADDDLDILAWTMLGEAGGEGQQGMADVGHVVLNRVNSGRYGASIQDVALAPKQFSTWNSGAGGNDPKGKYPKDSAAFQRARQIAEQVVAGTIPGPPGKPLDYHATSVSPYWADSKAGNGAITRNGHTFYPSVPVPPGELPEVATALSTVPTPRNAPTPVTPSIDMAMMRRGAAPSQLIPDTFAGLSKPLRNLGDELGMSPIPGGKQQAPLFDAGFDTRTNSMRLFSNGPADTQGVFTGASKAPAPIPALPSPQLAGRRATDPALRAALNAKYPAQLPPMPPSTRSVATTTIRPSASDMVRGNPMQTREQATTIASIPTRPQVSASDMARGRSGISTVATIPTTGFPTTEQIVAGSGFPPAIPDRLLAGEPGLPELYGNGGVAGVGTRAIAPTPFTRPQSFPTQFAAAPRIAPVPFQRPTSVGTQLSVRPMPPMPIVRPGIGGPARIPPRPMPASMRPFAVAPQIRTPLSSLTFAENAINRSGDDSVGSQADAAAARSSGEGGRNRRY